MKARIDFNTECVEAQRHRLDGWLDEAEAGDMGVDEMIDRLSTIVAELDDQVSVLRRVAG